MPVAQAFIPDEIGKVELTELQKDELRADFAIHLKDMTARSGKTFSADVQYNAERRGIEYLFEKQYKMKYGQEIGGVKLTNHQVDAFNDGRAIKVENMVTKSGNLTSSFLKRNALTGKTDYTRYNPDNPGEIIIPKEINGVKTTAEEQKELSQGKPIYLYDMTGTDHEKFSGYIKLDMNTGAQMYSSTVEGFEHKQSFKIPEKILGKKLTAKQRAEL